MLIFSHTLERATPSSLSAEYINLQTSRRDLHNKMDDCVVLLSQILAL